VERPQIVHLASVTSTQDVARDLPIGSVVVADFQTAGRGRLAHTWEAPAGSSLLVSFVLAPNPVLSLAAGVAAAEACDAEVRLRWPNDLLIDGRKVGGILVEAARDKAICGIGINLTWAPPGAAMLNQPRDVLLERLQPAIERWSSTPPDAVLARWRRLSDTIGRKVRVDLPNQVIEGTAEDINERGELIVDGIAVSAGGISYITLPPSGGGPA
jgi:BirA family biotin operon repressor/biotin-[acetyl-CoA-carboxylase] ligase